VEPHPPVEGAPLSRFRVREAAALVGVSDDTVRRWIDNGLPAQKDDSGRLTVAGLDLLAAADRHRAAAPQADGVASSARNRFVGLVTDVTSDTVMSQVQLRCGPHTVTSLMSTESVRRLGLRPGCLATAVVKATTVIVETPGGMS